MAKRSDQQIALRRRPARMPRIDRLTLTSQVAENPLERRLLLDAGDHPQLPAAAPADLDVDSKNPLETLCPGQHPFPVAARYLAALLGNFGCGARLGHDPGPVRARRREHAVVPSQVRAGQGTRPLPAGGQLVTALFKAAKFPKVPPTVPPAEARWG